MPRLTGLRLATLTIACAFAGCHGRSPGVEPSAAQIAGPQVLLRLDDVGMNHAVNLAIQRVAEAGIPFSTSVLFVGPWYQEAVDILERYPHVSVGVHLALNSEWRHYRWGPVLGAAAVPTLVDSNGYFFHSGQAFRDNRPDLAQVERELTAQVERALRSGLRIDYVDYHMGTAVSTPELRAIVERVAAKRNLGVSRYFGEAVFDLFATPANEKTTALTTRMRTFDATRPTLVVIHVAEDLPEMRALFDMNFAGMNSPSGDPLTWMHRKAELDMLLSTDFARTRRETGARLMTYRELIAARGLGSMRRPGN